MAKSELSRAAIVDRALEIADVEGLDAITIRRISKEFGVTPMALYWHVQNKDELLAAMGDALFAGLSTEVDPSDDWTAQLHTMVTRLVDALRRHPGSVPLAFYRVLYCPEGLAMAEFVFDLLRRNGFSPRDAANVGTHAMRTAVQLVDNEPGREFAETAEEREAHLATKQAALAALPVEQFPRLRELSAVMFDCGEDDEYYRSGIDLYVLGVGQLAARVH